MRFSRPSTGTILGALALFIALGGTAFAATATIVNIADPTTPSRVAHVDAAGRLQVGGSVSVNGAPVPSAYFHSAAFGGDSARGCFVVAAPPAGKAMIVRQLRINVFADPSPGPGQRVVVFGNTNCASPPLADVNPATVGQTVVPFDPGLGIRSGSGLTVQVMGSVETEVFTDGYSVPSSTVPAAPATATASKTRLAQQQQH